MLAERMPSVRQLFLRATASCKNISDGASVGIIAARVKKSLGRTPGSQPVTKFKIRCSKYLYTFVSNDAEKAEKLRQALPPSTLSLCPRL